MAMQEFVSPNGGINSPATTQKRDNTFMALQHVNWKDVAIAALGGAIGALAAGVAPAYSMLIAAIAGVSMIVLKVSRSTR